MCKKSNFKHAPCPTCLGKVVGRTDKVFCSVPCKNKHHSSARALVKSRLNELKERLRRNLVVLEGVVGRKGKKVELHRQALFKKGFDFQGFTSAYQKGRKLIFELGNYFFNFLSNGKVYVERVGELSENMPVFFRRWEIDFPDGKIVGGDVGSDSSG
jgi:hypothetical protein